MSSTGLRFRTPADVRAIPSSQWEEWIRAKVIPWEQFAPDVYAVGHTIAKATLRRMDATRNR